MSDVKYNIVMLVLCVAVVGAAFMVDIDKFGSRIFGAKWHLRGLDENFNRHHIFYDMFKSFNYTARGEFGEAFRWHLLGPVVLGYFILQIPYRLWAVTAGPDGVGTELKKAHSMTAAWLLIAMFVNVLIVIWEKMI